MPGCYQTGQKAFRPMIHLRRVARFITLIVSIAVYFTMKKILLAEITHVFRQHCIYIYIIEIIESLIYSIRIHSQRTCTVCILAYMYECYKNCETEGVTHMQRGYSYPNLPHTTLSQLLLTMCNGHEPCHVIQTRMVTIVNYKRQLCVNIIGIINRLCS